MGMANVCSLTNKPGEAYSSEVVTASTFVEVHATEDDLRDAEIYSR